MIRDAGKRDFLDRSSGARVTVVIDRCIRGGVAGDAGDMHRAVAVERHVGPTVPTGQTGLTHEVGHILPHVHAITSFDTIAGRRHVEVSDSRVLVVPERDHGRVSDA